MTENRYVFETILDGYVNCGEPSGQYNNCGFAFKLPPGVLEQAEKDRKELLEWAKSKAGTSRVAPPKWQDDGTVKFTFDGDTGRKRPVFVDTCGEPLGIDVQKTIRKGTAVKLICIQTPYPKPNPGTTIKVQGVQVVKLVTQSGAVDSGELTVEDVNQLFGSTEGFKSSSPAVTVEAAGTPSSVESYDF